jgi:hypothetical protein
MCEGPKANVTSDHIFDAYLTTLVRNQIPIEKFRFRKVQGD